MKKFYEIKNLLQDVYKLQGETRGKVLMINNTFSNTKDQREGSSVDVKNLTELFEQLHFDVVAKTDLTAKVTITIMYTLLLF